MMTYFKQIQILTLSLMALTLASFNSDSGQQDLASVHDYAGYVFKGQVKSISYDFPITVRFKNLNYGAKGRFETVKLCDYNKDDLETVGSRLNMELLNKAIADGRMVKVSYNSLISPCLQGITENTAEADFEDIK